MIVFSGVTKEFSGVPVLTDITFQLAPGEFACITGPSGAGKSTIVNLLIRADFPSEGSITVDDADIATFPVPILQMYRRKIGVMFQDYKLLPDRTVFENVAFALEVSDEPDDVITESVTRILTELRMQDRADAFPHELAGGEQARTALARALVRNPSVLIADEPTGNIDPEQSREILDMLKAINSRGTTVILTTHDQHLVQSMGVRILHLTGGRIVSDSGAPVLQAVAPLASNGPQEAGAPSNKAFRPGRVKPIEE